MLRIYREIACLIGAYEAASYVKLIVLFSLFTHSRFSNISSLKNSSQRKRCEVFVLFSVSFNYKVSEFSWNFSACKRII